MSTCGCSGPCRCRAGGGITWKRSSQQLKDARERMRLKREAQRELILKHYGNKCKCCGESIKRFLTIDHKEGGGSRRRALRINQRGESPRLIGRDWYRDIINQGFPKDLQILCYNCNCGRHLNGGICPHKQKKG